MAHQYGQSYLTSGKIFGNLNRHQSCRRGSQQRAGGNQVRSRSRRSLTTSEALPTLKPNPKSHRSLWRPRGDGSLTRWLIKCIAEGFSYCLIIRKRPVKYHHLPHDQPEWLCVLLIGSVSPTRTASGSLRPSCNNLTNRS